jgi:hypothetical protein
MEGIELPFFFSTLSTTTHSTTHTDREEVQTGGEISQRE